MAPTSFDQWFAIHNAKSENKISEELKSLFEECWNTARANIESDNKDLEDEINCNSCPFDYCRCSDYDDVEIDLEDAIESTDYQLIVDSIKKDFDNTFDDFFEAKRNFEVLDI